MGGRVGFFGVRTIAFTDCNKGDHARNRQQPSGRIVAGSALWIAFTCGRLHQIVSVQQWAAKTKKTEGGTTATNGAASSEPRITTTNNEGRKVQQLCTVHAESKKARKPCDQKAP